MSSSNALLPVVSRRTLAFIFINSSARTNDREMLSRASPIILDACFSQFRQEQALLPSQRPSSRWYGIPALSTCQLWRGLHPEGLQRPRIFVWSPASPDPTQPLKRILCAHYLN